MPCGLPVPARASEPLGRRSADSGRQRVAGLRFALRLVHRPDHVERALRVVLEFIAQDALAAVQRILQADQLALAGR